MRNYQKPFLAAALICVCSMIMSSCGYTNKTGSSANLFSKRHYSRTSVKKKDKKSDKEQEIVLEELVMTKKENKEEIITQAENFEKSKDLVASSNESEVIESDPEYVESMIQEKINTAKEQVLELKKSATTEKQKRKADKSIARLEKLEHMTSKLAPKAAIAAAAPNRDEAGRKGLAALILGALGLVIAGLIAAIAAVILGKKAKAMSTAGTQAHTHGRIGRILGWVGIGLFLFAFALIILSVAIII